MGQNSEKVIKYTIEKEDEVGTCDRCGRSLAIGDRAIIRGRGRYCGLECSLRALGDELKGASAE